MDSATKNATPDTVKATRLDGKSLDVAAEKLARLRELMPEIFAEGKLDVDKLKLVLGEDVYVGEERYGLNWPGKAEAYREIQKRTTATLVPDREGSVDFDTAENVFIEGENLEVLRVLQKSYFGKVKMIYIDPPYNTGNDSFVYPDDYTERKEVFGKRSGQLNEDGYLNKLDLWRANSKDNGQFHSVWLSMMLPRLYLSRNLLREDGAIFVSIDDTEAMNLRQLLDEVFGAENFVAQVVWQRAFSPINLKKHFSESHDYILCYAKNLENFTIKGLTREGEALERYKNIDDDPRGPWTSGGLDVGPVVPSKVYPITTPNGRVVYPPDGYCWRVTKEKFEELKADNRIYFGKEGKNVPRLKRFLTDVKDSITPMTLWTRNEVGDSQSASRDLKALFGGKSLFDYPKPVGLIKRCIELVVNDGELVLDFFAGSGTTAQAVMEFNAEKSVKCRFLLTQLAEPIKSNQAAIDAGYESIAEITKERIRLAIKEQKKSMFASDGLGFRAFKLSGTALPVWNEAIDISSAKQLQFYLEPELKHGKADFIFEIGLRLGYGLSMQLSTLDGLDDLYLINQETVVCLADNFNKNHLDSILGSGKVKVEILDRGFQSDQSKTNAALTMREAGIEQINFI
ncbi:DNA methyltransferase [Hymenobacter sp. UYCo722]|uniref:site-specific DNA-methyltransferase n=1 Tax=Hymenobacter sp. UYCo722 TaxID=3156335 RepID=UPI0033967EA9